MKLMFYAMMLTIVMIFISGIVGCAQQEDFLEKRIPLERYCKLNEDCIPNKCCHPTYLVNKKYGHVCNESVFCSIAIEDKTRMDVEKWEPACRSNICEVIYE